MPQSLSRAANRLCLSALVLVLASCKDSIGPVAEYTLTVVAEPGAQVSPAPGTHPYSEGTVVSYAASPRAGYRHLALALDSALVAPQGTIRMDRDRVLYVSADPTENVLPSGEPVVLAAKALLGSGAPAQAFRTMLEEYTRLVQRVGSDSAAVLMQVVDAVVFDPAIVGDDLRRVSQALNGLEFEYVPPAPPASSAFRIAQSAATIVGADTLVRTVFLHTNGILNGPAAAQAGLVAMAGAAIEAGFPLVQLGDDSWAARGRVAYRMLYNHSMLDFTSNCAFKLFNEITRRGLAFVRTVPWHSRSMLEARLGCTLRDDVSESLSQMLRHMTGVPSYLPGDAVRLRGRVNSYRTMGYNVVLTAHSQGNLMTMDALAGIEPRRAGQPTCVSYVGIAPPLFANHAAADPAEAILVGTGRALDFVARLPGPKPPPVDSEMSKQYDQEWPLWTYFAGDTAEAIYSLYVGYKLHGLTESYLHRQSPSSRQWVVGRLRSQYGSLASRCGGYLAGRVVDGRTGRVIAGATIHPANDTARVLATTDAGGRFRTGQLPARPQNLILRADSYVGVALNAIEPEQLDTLPIGDIPLAPASARPGGIRGRVLNARNLSAVSGATVVLRQGVNATTGPIAATATTSTTGGYAFSGFAAGTYSLSVSAPAFVTETRTGVIIGETELAGQDVLIAPSIDDIIVRLRWGATPADLDAHLVGPTEAGGRFLVYWASRGNYNASPWAGLDVDIVTGFGPETMTITKLLGGTYRFAVHNYTNRNSLGNSALSLSGATVSVYRRGRLVQVFNVPAGTGTYWHVFEVVDGTIRTTNTINNTAPTSLPSGAPTRAAALMPEKSAVR